MNSVLFQPFRLHDLTLPNRVVLAPMTRGRAGAARLPNRMMAEYYTQRSSAGLVITEATTISEEANGWNESPGIYTDEMAEGWKQTTNAVHEKGGVIFLQLWHMGRASHSSFHGGQPAVAPSAIKINEPENHPLQQTAGQVAFRDGYGGRRGDRVPGRAMPGRERSKRTSTRAPLPDP